MIKYQFIYEKDKGLRIMHTKLTGFNGRNVTLERFPTCLADGTCIYTVQSVTFM
jgi:hypothetical protein